MPNNEEGNERQKNLIVYYSRTGKTKFVAETIAAELGPNLKEKVDLTNRERKMDKDQFTVS